MCHRLTQSAGICYLKVELALHSNLYLGQSRAMAASDVKTLRDVTVRQL
jgi:hypothetical protein